MRTGALISTTWRRCHALILNFLNKLSLLEDLVIIIECLRKHHSSRIASNDRGMDCKLNIVL